MRHRDIIDINQPTRPYFDAVAADAGEVIKGYLQHHAYADAARFQRQMITILDGMIVDTIGTAWRKAVRSQFREPAKATAWKAKALNFDASDPMMSIALSCFAPMRVDGHWFLAVPLPLPCPLGSKFAQPEEIALIDPHSGRVILHSGDTETLVSQPAGDRFTVTADGKTWAREIASAAIEWFFRKEEAGRCANIDPFWSGCAPSALAVGDIAKIIWPRGTAITAGAGVDAAKLKKAIFRQARVTHVESHLQIARAA